MLPENIVVHEPSQVSPIIISIPHGGTIIPKQFAESISVPVEQLWSDWYTDELYSFLKDMNVAVVKTRLSRFVADVNRDPTKPLFAPFWKGIIASETPFGDKVYSRDLAQEELDQRIAVAYTPYHTELNKLVEKAKQYHKRVLVLDLHSFGMPLETDFVIGDGNGETLSASTLSLIERTLSEFAFSCQYNKPFRGGWIIRQFSNDARVEAVQLELNQRMYADKHDIDEAKPLPARDDISFGEAQARLKEVFARMITEFQKVAIRQIN